MSRFRKKPKQWTVPTEADWGDYRADLDQNDAHDLFVGRTNQEMQPYFRMNPIERTSDLRFMPEIPFRYYMLGFRDSVMAGDFKEGWASDAASCFLELVAEKLANYPRSIMPIMPELLPAIEHVAQNQAAYGAADHIYGSFLDKLAHIQALYADRGGVAYSKQLNAFL